MPLPVYFIYLKNAVCQKYSQHSHYQAGVIISRLSIAIALRNSSVHDKQPHPLNIIPDGIAEVAVKLASYNSGFMEKLTINLTPFPML